MKRIFCLFLVSLFLLYVYGCSNFMKKSDQGSLGLGVLEPSVSAHFNDIPIPAGFRLIPADSYSFQNSNTRVALLKYIGKATPEQLINFYKERMPANNWNLINIIEYGQRYLNFDKEDEACIIVLEQRGGKVLITVSLGPKSKIQTKKAKEPIK